MSLHHPGHSGVALVIPVAASGAAGTLLSRRASCGCAHMGAVCRGCVIATYTLLCELYPSTTFTACCVSMKLVQTLEADKAQGASNAEAAAATAEARLRAAKAEAAEAAGGHGRAMGKQD